MEDIKKIDLSKLEDDSERLKILLTGIMSSDYAISNQLNFDSYLFITYRLKFLEASLKNLVVVALENNINVFKEIKKRLITDFNNMLNNLESICKNDPLPDSKVH